jgi:hypothetical protein
MQVSTIITSGIFIVIFIGYLPNGDSRFVESIGNRGHIDTWVAYFHAAMQIIAGNFFIWFEAA